MSVSLPAGRPRRLKELSPPVVAEILRRDPRLLVPVGATEPHGAHLPMGCDTIIVERLADDLSARFGVLRAPTVEYGVNAPPSTPTLGAAGVRKKTLHRLLNDLAAAWEGCGVDELILLTAHAHDPHQEALATVITARARVRVVDLFAIDLGDLLEGQLEPMHGDEVDTSLLLHLAPELVHLDAAQDYMVERGVLRRFRRGRQPPERGVTGSLGRPSLASADKGRRLYERILDRVAQRVLGAPPLLDE
ncbi:MAG: creatininase family protein [Gemmatirosa sp.]|nr:creatininase family protein [Gemmatirosa sp.]